MAMKSTLGFASAKAEARPNRVKQQVKPCRVHDQTLLSPNESGVRKIIEVIQGYRLALSFPAAPPASKLFPLRVKKAALAGAELVAFMDFIGEFCMAFQDHQFPIVENKVGAFIVGGKNVEGLGKLSCVSPGLNVPGGGFFAQFDKSKHFLGQSISDSGNGSDCPAMDKSVEYLGVDSDHESEVGITARDVFCGIGERIGPAEFLETNQVGIVFSKIKEEFGFGFKTVV